MSHLKGVKLSNPIHFLALGFGLGLARKAPGTFGTLAAFPFYFLMMGLSLPWYIGITAVMGVIGIYLCHKTAADMGEHDHPAIVWDEVVGMLITLIAAPAGIGYLVLGFVLFRFFDILKPWPIKWLDKKVHGGFGIMIDDVLAGLAALVCLQAIAQQLA